MITGQTTYTRAKHIKGNRRISQSGEAWSMLEHKLRFHSVICGSESDALLRCSKLSFGIHGIALEGNRVGLGLRILPYRHGSILRRRLI
jgi:hypothetical protein